MKVLKQFQSFPSQFSHGLKCHNHTSLQVNSEFDVDPLLHKYDFLCGMPNATEEEGYSAG